ncbi:hypothetical protein A2738_02310 [Candidatus Nomurabacteria bacterium RIFCSPHIGHO2_01_FULL_42_15]|uniref:Uncharacterized protein n=1 Tax=Candidatus Nomurabacteria bacterium RIFCSPHIGHO2_01_FULL_42_15 TaxID=1801742 RepID=A0A1F6VF91_9BACT|nr:MAG: hypothetical protein A2738_02310 [Candidatus Nomurabacteria bacterium RIFCSPHIGHO2_01_FULL_42_15]OGI93433.1 MAG: hypothetical protein A3A99_02040 [Candidatus Nomurabacteria bacterium RIFCSPLOWO2_01_FULL_41_18]
MQNKIKKINTGRQILNLSKGYTIIETMISVSLFLVIVMAGMGALLNSNLLHQKSRDMRSIMDNLSFIMEDLSKNLRTGYNYHCVDDLSNDFTIPASGEDCFGIAFEHQDGEESDPSDQWVYIIGNDGKIYKSTENAAGSENFVQLTPDEIEIDTTKSGFSVTGAEPPDICEPPTCIPRTVTGNKEQPFVIIRLTGTITSKNTIETPFSLQTSVSQRAIDKR